MKKYAIWILVILIVAFIILPTGTPEDLITTIPLIAWLGWKTFLWISVGIIALIWIITGINPFKLLK